MLLKKGIVLTIFNSLVLFACGGSGDDSPAAKADPVEGVFEVVDYQQNSFGCDDSNLISSTLNHNHLFILKSAIFGSDFYNVYSCTDLNDCKNKKQQFQAGNFPSFDYFYSFETSYGPEGYSGELANTGFRLGNICTNGRIENLSLRVDNTTSSTTAITITVTKTPADDYAPDATGSCTGDGVRTAAQNNLCSSKLVYNAALVESF